MLKRSSTMRCSFGDTSASSQPCMRRYGSPGLPGMQGTRAAASGCAKTRLARIKFASMALSLTEFGSGKMKLARMESTTAEKGSVATRAKGCGGER